jgi:hypothetical protein
MTHDLHSPPPLCHLLQVANIGPPPIGFNVSHDNELVAMAFAPGEFGPPAFLIGVDVMRVRVPTGGLERAALFLRAVGETTVSGCALLVSDPLPSPLMHSSPSPCSPPVFPFEVDRCGEAPCLK